MLYSYELGHPQYRKIVMIKHKGIPMHIGDRLITPHSIVWWWPGNWLVAVLNFWRAFGLLKRPKE